MRCRWAVGGVKILNVASASKELGTITGRIASFFGKLEIKWVSRILHANERNISKVFVVKGNFKTFVSVI